ncbi:MAG: helix-turn-helix domain-containing protein [Nocardioidaceae bacterium]
MSTPDVTVTLDRESLYSHLATANITPDELADRIGVARSTVWRVLTGAVNPSPKFIACLLADTGHHGEDFHTFFRIERAA